MEYLKFWMLLIFFYFSSTRARSLNSGEKEGKILQRAVRDLFMIYQQEHIETRLVSLIQGDSGKSLNESDYHVTMSSGKLPCSVGRCSDENSGIPSPLLDAYTNGDDDEKIDLLLRIYARLRSNSLGGGVGEKNKSDERKNNQELSGDVREGLKANSGSNDSQYIAISLNEANGTDNSHGFDSDGKEESKSLLINETATEGERSNVQSSVIDSSSKLQEDNGHHDVKFGNATRKADDDVDVTNIDAENDVLIINSSFSHGYARSNDSESDMKYLPVSRSDEKEDDSGQTENVSERYDEYDFINFKRNDVDMHFKTLDEIENDNSKNKTTVDINDNDDKGEVNDENDENVDEGDSDDDDDADGSFTSVMNPNDHEELERTNGNQESTDHITIPDDHGGRINDMVDDHDDDKGRTTIRDEDAEKFLRWLLRYILRKMDDSSESEKDTIPNRDEIHSPQDEATAKIRKYLTNSDKKGQLKQQHSFAGEGTNESHSDVLAQRWSDGLGEGDSVESRFTLEEKDEDPGTLLQKIINLKDMERRRQIRDLVGRLRKRSEKGSHMKSTSYV